MARKNISILELCLARAVKLHGLNKGGRVGGRQAAFVVEWARYLDETGDDPGNAWAFARWANIGHGTAYNRLAEWRELFPEDGHETPAPLARYVSRSKRRRTSRSALPA